MESSEKEFQDLQQKRMKEIVDTRNKTMTETILKAKRYQLIYLLFELVAGILGYLIIGFAVNWWLVLGMFLIGFSDRLQTVRTIYQNDKSIWKEIWKL